MIDTGIQILNQLSFNNKYLSGSDPVIADPVIAAITTINEA